MHNNMNTTTVNMCSATDSIAKKDRKTSRDERDAHMRKLARRNYREVRKLLPKSVRTREVREERKAMDELVQSCREADIEVQGNFAETAVKVAAGVGIGAFLMKTGSAISRVLRKTEKLTDKANELLEQVVDFISGLKQQAQKLMGFLWVIPCAVLLFWLKNTIGDNRLVWASLAVLLLPVFGKQMWEVISPYLPCGIRPQAADTQLFAGLIVSVLSFSFLPSKASSLVPAILQRLSFFPKATDGLMGLYNFAVSMFETVINLVFQVAGFRDSEGNVKVVYFGDAISKTVKKWVNESHKYANELRLNPSLEIITKAQEHVVTGYSTLQLIKDKKLHDAFVRSLRDYEEKCRSTLPIMVSGQNLRPEPEMVLLVGAPGVGKTCMISRMAMSILLMAGETTPEHALKNIWQKGSSEYWNGYVRQKAVIFDDLFQKLDKVGCAESEVFDIIRMISNWTYPLNMADLESKGKIQFDSPLVLGTTNCYNITQSTWNQVINNKEALLRRIHHPVYVQVSQEYALDGRLNYEKFESEYLANINSLKELETITVEQYINAVPWHAWDAWKIKDYDTFSGPKDNSLNDLNRIALGQFVQGVAAKLRSKKTRHIATLDSMIAHASLAKAVKPQARSTDGSQPETPASFVDERASGSGEVGERPVSPDPNLGYSEIDVDESVDVPIDFIVRDNSHVEDYDRLEETEYIDAMFHQEEILEGQDTIPVVNRSPGSERDLGESTEIPNDPINANTWFDRWSTDYHRENPHMAAARLQAAVIAFDSSFSPLTEKELGFTDRCAIRNHFYKFFAEFAGRQEEYGAIVTIAIHKLRSIVDAIHDCPFDISTSATKREFVRRFNELANLCRNYDVVVKWDKGYRHYAAVTATLTKLKALITEANKTRNDMQEALDEEFGFIGMCKHMVRVVQEMWKCDNVLWKIAGVAMGVSLAHAGVRLFRLFWGCFRAGVGLIAKCLGFRDPEEEIAVVTNNEIKEQNTAAGASADVELSRTISGNMFGIWCPAKNLSPGNLLFIGSTVAIMPRHFIKWFEDEVASGLSPDAKLHLLQANAKERTRPEFTVGELLGYKRFIPEQNSDFLFIEFPLSTGLQAKRDITNHFSSADKMLAIARSKPGVSLHTIDTCKKPTDDRVRVNGLVYASHYVERVTNRPVGSVTPDFLWKSSMDSKSGDCGGFLMVRRAADAPDGRILGIHIGGNCSMGCSFGYAQPVSRETVIAAKKHFGTIEDQGEIDLHCRGITLHTEHDPEPLIEGGLVRGSFDYIGMVEPSDGVSLSPISSLTKTVLYHEKTFGDSGLDIAHLRPVLVEGELKYPMVEALKNYQTPVEYVDIPNKKLLFSVAMQKFTDLSVRHTRDILDFEEAVSGPFGLKMKAINRATSSGYPFVLMGYPGKTAFFGNGEDFSFASERCDDLRERVHYIISQAKKGVRLGHICLDFLKDETRPLAKVEAVATRAISGSPVDYVIAFRMLFGSFMAAMYAHHTDSGFTPGINPYRQWWMLASNHQTGGRRSEGKKKFHFDGDFSRFDASEQPFLLWSILDYVNEWYNDGPEMALARKTLWLEVVHSRHISTLQGKSVHIIQWNKSLPSGHPMTTIINSMYAMFSLVYCYAKATGDLTGFWDHCHSSTNGDDNLNTTDETVIDKFNQVTVAEHMKDLHLTYTSGSKDGKLVPHVPFEKLTYLKRRFRRDYSDEHDSGGWTAPLELQSFLFSSYFTKNKRCVSDDVTDKLEFALGELCLHEPEVWNEHAPKVHEVLKELNRAPKYGNAREAYVSFMKTKVDFWY